MIFMSSGSSFRICFSVFVLVLLRNSVVDANADCSADGGGKRCESCSQIQPEWPVGEQGESGDVGQRGDRGVDGDDGQQGAPGDSGSQGEQGPDGATGSKGEKGAIGELGDTGDLGAPGQATEADKGEKGVIGTKGQKGVPGFAGCVGPQGKLGIIGEKGETGQKGKGGPTGKIGLEGDVGPRGGAGPRGSRGRMGRKGVVGDVGEKGMIGPVGDTGEMGQRGTTGPAGSVDKDYSLVQGPRGPKGDRGDIECNLEADLTAEDAKPYRGGAGDKGETGPKGDIGPSGDVGQTGPECVCNKTNPLEAKAPRGIAGPSGPPGDSANFKGESGQTPECTCNDKCLKFPYFPPRSNLTVPVKKPITVPPGVAGPTGPQGGKGEDGPPGPGAQGEKGARGIRGKGACCKKPPVEKSFGRTPTIYVVHSQSKDLEKVKCGEDDDLLWTGFSFLSADINRVATGQDLGKPGSCVARLDPLPYTDCPSGMPCNFNQRSMQAIWLMATDIEQNITSQVPFDKLSQYVSRCAVCIAKSPVITLHRTRTCPDNTRPLWTGYSLAMFSSSMLSVSADLSHSGSCLPSFKTALVIECDTSQNCRQYHDLRSHWLHGLNGGLPGDEANCVVCADHRSNDYDRDLPRPRIYVEHYQSPVAPLNPCSSAPGVFPIMANGYSLLHLEDTRAVVQDLGSAGSCLPRFSPVPFLTCPTIGPCYAKERQTKASWLRGISAQPRLSNNVNLATSPSDLSRCSICISDAPVVTFHSHTTSIPSCPKTAGRWVSLWTGYSFLGHFSGAAGGQQNLDSPGSCLREFTSPVYFECAGATGDCRSQSDQHDFWLTASNSDASQRPTSTRLLAINHISRCVVCKMLINN